MSKVEAVAMKAPESDSSAPKPQANGREPVQVYVLQLLRPIDLPNKIGADSCTWSYDESRKVGHQIHYLPWMRHHEVTYSSPEGKVTKRLVHESWATWVPR